MQIGIMIEGQDGLNWPRWQRLLKAAEDLGYQCVFRSDHFTNAAGEDKDSLELWVSLTYAATHTQNIEFGPLVTPVTFRHPAMTVRMAAAVDDLSDGRLILGMGAGWQEREHTKFDVPFHDFPTRYAMFENALEITERLLHSEEAIHYEGEYFSLRDAVLLPRPNRAGGPPILIGGNGPKRTLPLVARFADEWNSLFLNVDAFKEHNALLNDLLAQNGREPGEVKRSMMTGTVFAADDAALDAAIEERRRRASNDISADDLIGRGLIVGTPSMWIDQLGKLHEAGLQRIMLQWLNLDDIHSLEIIARDVLPHFHKA